MIGSVNLNTPVMTQTTAQLGQVKQAPKTEVNESQAAEKNEAPATQMREPEANGAAAGLLKTLNASETQTLPPTNSQQNVNAQTNRVNGLKAYNEVGKSEFSFS